MLRIFLAIALLPLSLLAQPVGQTFVAGTTRHDAQGFYSIGSTIAVDFEGYVNVVWLNSVNDFPNPRRGYWNIWLPDSQRFRSDNGFAIDPSSRGSSLQIAVTPTAHAIIAKIDIYSVDNILETCVDNSPRMGAWSCYSPAGFPERQFIDPRISVQDTILHMLSRESSSGAIAIRYDRGRIIFDDFGQGLEVDFFSQILLDSTAALGHALADDYHSPQVAAVWTRPVQVRGGQSNICSDVIIAVSEDQGANWSPSRNITNFWPVDTLCCDSISSFEICRRDTLAASSDVALSFDRFGALHAAFNVRSIFFESCDSNNGTWINQSMLYHWSESTNQFSLIADGYWPWPEIIMDNGAWQLNVQRPSLAEDTTTGFLYCAYMQYDTNCYSDAYYPMADIYISVSTDNGARWSVGTNVTRTCPGQNIAPPGSMHERDHSLAEYVSDGVLHLFYCLDRDAGSSSSSEGISTENDMLYQRIPVDSIPTTPLIENYPLHWDSTGFYAAADDRSAPLPTEITLRAYPNPFNSTAQIEFTINRAAKISVTIHDILGRELTTLANKSYTSGTHKLNWPASQHASGIYFVSLKSATTTQTQKLLLLR